MKRGKKIPNEIQKPIPPSLLEEWVKEREPDAMIDDHGPVILGGRDRKPRLPVGPKED